jgi:MFS family permease
MQSTDVQKLEQEYPEYIEKVKKNYWWNFMVIMLDSAFFSFSVTMLSQDTIIPYFVSHLTGQKIFIGLVPALFYLGYYLPQLIGAYVVTGKPRRKIFIFWIAVTQRVGILVIALLTQFLGWFNDQQALALLMISITLYSITFGLIIPAYSDFISKNIIRRRGFFYGAMNALGGAIGFAASLTATYFLNRYEYPANLRLLFWVGFAASFISPFFIAAYREVPFPFKGKMEPLGDFFKSIPAHIKTAPGFSRFMGVRALLNMGLMANAFYALYAMQRFNLPDGVLGIITMIILLSQSFVGFLWGWLGDRFGFKRVYIIASVLVILMGLLAVSATGIWAFYIIAFCIGGLYAVNRTADANMVFELAPPRETSRFIGIANTFVAPVVTLAPLIGGVIVNAFSHQVLFWCVLVIGALSALFTIRYMPNPRLHLPNPPNQPGV